ncbi:MAG: three-Cys-motif partner protein TcmP [Magnetococcales bacterium]|nr:three-Cys-motif partner protein TcmP [Magnetococcales bacterium]
MAKQQFGGDWTQEKLHLLGKYLKAYTTIMAKQPFKFAYIDAFAGTGYREERADGDHKNSLSTLFPEMAKEGPQGFFEGSARVALGIEPRFLKYIFIEKSKERSEELEKLKQEFPDREIHVKNGDANNELRMLCDKNENWRGQRAVLFLDPFGMNVEWSTIRAIAGTKAIDMWLLFPLDSGVHRMLTNDGKMSEGWRNRLDLFFGENNWREAFYEKRSQKNLFGEEEVTRRTADYQVIEDYFVKRLESVFEKVAQRPRKLYNSKGKPLFMLCFAAGNLKGAPIAVKIANHILKEPRHG